MLLGIWAGALCPAGAVPEAGLLTGWRNSAQELDVLWSAGVAL